MSEPFVPTWRDIALCREVDPEIFFPPRGSSARPAKQVCGACSVRAECLEEALSYFAQDDYGIRGGLSERERKRLRQAQRPATVTSLPMPVVATEQHREAA